MEKEWIKINNLEEIRIDFTEKVVLLENKSGSRTLAHVILDARGNHKLRGYNKNSLKKYKILAYYKIAEWEFCLIPFGTEMKLPKGSTEQNCEAYTLWGTRHGGMLPVEHQIVRVVNGHPYFCTGWYGAGHPDYLLGYHILPDMYLFEPEGTSGL